MACKLPDNQQTVSGKTRVFTVKTFSARKPDVTVKLPTTPDQRLTVGRVKLKVAEALKLKERSLNIFGIFLGTLGSPRELLLDADFIPENSHDICFQRLSFDKDNEMRVTIEDKYAMKLIFWETKNMYDRGKILPRPNEEKLSSIATLLQPTEGKPITSKPKFSCMKRFMEIIRAIPFFYWSFYYRADYCILQCPISSSDSEIGEGAEVHVVLNMEELLFLDVSGKHEVASWFWDEVHLLRVNKGSTQQLITFEVMTENEEEEPSKDFLKCISLETDRSEYLYSIAVHILKVLEERFSSKHLQPPEDHVYEVINTGFRKKMLLPKPRTDAYYTFQVKVDDVQLKVPERKL